MKTTPAIQTALKSYKAMEKLLAVATPEDAEAVMVSEEILDDVLAAAKIGLTGREVSKLLAEFEADFEAVQEIYADAVSAMEDAFWDEVNAQEDVREARKDAFVRDEDEEERMDAAFRAYDRARFGEQVSEEGHPQCDADNDIPYRFSDEAARVGYASTEVYTRRTARPASASLVGAEMPF